MNEQIADFNLSTLENTCLPLSDADILCPAYELLGMVTAVASAPELIMPSEWMPLIWVEEKGGKFETKEQAETIYQQLTAWWNYCMDGFAGETDFMLPDTIDFDEAGKPSPAMKDFASGYLAGSDWLEKVWDAYIPDEESESSSVLGSTLLLMAQCLLDDDKPLPEDMPDMLEMLNKENAATATVNACVEAVGRMGKELYVPESGSGMPFAANDGFGQFNEYPEDAILVPSTNPMKTVGRNDPCPCGSGKKFKKCCLN